jgi:serine/threonine protein kinase
MAGSDAPTTSYRPGIGLSLWAQCCAPRVITPSKILLTKSTRPILSDFGIAKLLESEDTRTLTGTSVGVSTPEY